ncbi:MAG: hypothetical protein PHY14_02780 [Candidatus Gracilibacteria bacterium]|nr:hypothetical protein [Candidatus Gracilibacteria bacterium]
MRQEIFEKIFDSGIILPSDNVPKYSGEDTSFGGFIRFVRGHGYEGDIDITPDATYNDLVEWVKHKVDYVTLCLVKTGGLQQCYAPFLSTSVGGIGGPNRIERYLYEGGLVAEMCIPEDEVLLPIGGAPNEGEKEVYVTRIKMDWILRAFVDIDQIKNEVFQNPNHPMNKYYNGTLSEAINAWRFQERKADYLPLGYEKTFFESGRFKNEDGKIYLI